MTPYVDSVRWQDLQHAYGSAADVPEILQQIAKASGRRRHHSIGELCSRVLHQGTIYSASPPVVHFLINLLPAIAAEDKAGFYGLLDEFAQAARKAIADGRAIPSCAGGDPADGEAIRREILNAAPTFAPDIDHCESQIRSEAAALLTAFAGAEAAMIRLVRERYFAEPDPPVRTRIIEGLMRTSHSLGDWPEFLRRALETERDPWNRFLLRSADLLERKSSADQAAIDDLTANFVNGWQQASVYGADSEIFFDALETLGAERNLRAMLAAFDLASEQELVRILAESLLRTIFGDQRTGWGQIAISRVNEDGSRPPTMDMASQALRLIGKMILWKIFPFLRRWSVGRLRQTTPKGIQKIEYWGLEGPPPPLPQRLTESQQNVLNALAAKQELWQFRTNIWELFSLPASAEALSKFVADHTS